MITLVYPYFENGKMVERQLEEWSRYDAETKAVMRAVIVDDGSPNDPAAGHFSDPGFHVELYRIKQNLVWNVAGARNLGMDKAADGWCLLTDIDHVLLAHDAKRLVESLPDFDPAKFYVAARKWADGRELQPHTNSYILQRGLYWRVGGCDEDWTGWWGAGEHVFRKHINSIATRVDLADVYLTHYGREDIPDASTREWGRRDSPYHWGNNPALVAKCKLPPYRPDNPLRFDWERVS